MKGLPWTIGNSGSMSSLMGGSVLYDSDSNAVAEYIAAANYFGGFSMTVTVGQANYFLKRRRRLFRVWYEVTEASSGRFFAYATAVRFGGEHSWRLTDLNGNELALCDTSSSKEQFKEMLSFNQGEYVISVHGEPVFQCESHNAFEPVRMWPIKDDPLTPQQLQLCAVMVGMYMLWRDTGTYM